MESVREAALVYLADHHVMTLATVGADGAWAAAVFYVNDGFDLYFLSAAHTRHAQHLATSGQTAVTIQEDYSDWQAIKGIQLEGTVVLLDGDERDTAVARYKAKFPFLRQAPEPIQQALLKVGWYRLRPERLYFIDNSKGFGHRDEVPLS
jgi:uncharacterized protein